MKLSSDQIKFLVRLELDWELTVFKIVIRRFPILIKSFYLYINLFNINLFMNLLKIFINDFPDALYHRVNDQLLITIAFKKQQKRFANY